MRSLFLLLCLGLVGRVALSDSNVIEKQLIDIGTIPNDEVVVVQKKYTRKNFRHEITPIRFGGLPFGDIRRTLFAGASYTLHLSDSFALELFDFTYTKDFFTGFTSDISAEQKIAGKAELKPDPRKSINDVPLDCVSRTLPFLKRRPSKDGNERLFYVRSGPWHENFL